jgi:translocation and assembly module TamB
VLENPPDPQRLPFDLTVKAQQLDLRGFSGMTAMLPKTGGLLDLEVQARGTPRDPRVSGRVECTRCELQLDSMGDFQDIHLALHGDTNRIVLDELTAKSGAGHARVTAALARNSDGSAYTLSGTVDATQMPIYQEGQALATVNLNASLSGSAGGPRAKANVDIREARIRLSDEKRKNLQSLKPPEDIVLVQDGRPVDRRQAKRLRAVDERLDRLREGLEATAQGKPAAPPPPKTNTVGPWQSLLVTVTAPRKLWVTGNDVYLELGLSSNFRVRVGRDVQVYGQVVTHRGRINAFGRRFDLKADSTLEFGGPPDHPILDVTAQYQNDTENVTVLLTAKGPLDHLAIGVSSPNRPDLSQSQLYTLIITGHLQFGEGGGGSSGSAAASEASGLIAGAIAGGLQKTLAKRLPLDVLTIDAGSGGLTGTQFEAGRYMTDRLYVGYVGRIGADPTRYQNKNAVHVEYQLTSRWQFAGEYGDVGTGSADLIWKKNY